MQAVWIELPAQDLDRALAFYSAVFALQGAEIKTEETRRTVTLFNMTAEGKPGISLTETAGFVPSTSGALAYIYTGEDLTTHLGRVEPAGGSITTGKTSMDDFGQYAVFTDTEGNTLALYSDK